MTEKLEQAHKIHFIGVGGIGMSALARHFLQEKKQVSGSDRELTPLTKQLNQEGVQIFAEQVPENISKDIDLVVYTEAMAADHPELLAAKKLKVPTINYFEALSQAMNPYYLIAVAGTHGKTTTTAMITDIFEAAEKDPTAIIGSLRTSTKSNYRVGKSKYAIVEACEYKKDFLHLTPDILVITNIEFDHADYFDSLIAVQQAFKEMVERVHETGVIITDPTHPNIAPVIADTKVEIIDYKESLDISMSMKQPGIHNRLNAAAALAVAKKENISLDGARQSISNFTGTWRRFEYKGDFGGVPVYDDYAHHPTEIEASISAAREAHPHKKVVMIFQPHTYSRTKALFDEFAHSFSKADSVLLLPIYAAREENKSGVNSRELAVKALEYNPHVQLVESFEETTKVLKEKLSKDSVLLFMGAGNITELATELTK